MPISDCEVRDPRVRRTRQSLQSALRTLMNAKSFDEISVQDISEAAVVNRATFYDHYTDKYALLDSMVGGGFHQLLHERNVRFDGTCPRTIGAIVLAACDYLTESHGGSECRAQSAFEPLMDAAMTNAIRRILAPGVATQPNRALPAEIVATAASWAIYGAVKEWFAWPARPPARKIVAPVVELVSPMLGFALEGRAGRAKARVG